MTINPLMTFEIKTSKDLLKKLLEEYLDFDKQHLNPRFAINCAITAWHLTDWTYYEYYYKDKRFQDTELIDKKGCKKKIPGILKYQQFAKKNCPELELMRLITNGIKHCILNDNTRKEKTIVKEGDFSTEFSRHDFNVTRFEIEINKNKKIDFEKTLITVINYWKELLDSFEK
jgi:hypothetical protein